MTRPAILRAATALLLFLMLAGCGGLAPQTHYYSLYAPVQRAAASGPADSTLAVSVGPVVVPDILRQEQIAIGGSDGRYRLAEYHRWSGELDREFARALAERLAAGLGTEQVAIFPWDQNLNPTCRVLVDILSMGGEPGREATLSVRWSLVDPQGKRPSITRRSELREVPAEPGYAAWVAAQQRNIAQLGQEITAAIKAPPK